VLAQLVSTVAIVRRTAVRQGSIRNRWCQPLGRSGGGI